MQGRCPHGGEGKHAPREGWGRMWVVAPASQLARVLRCAVPFFGENMCMKPFRIFDGFRTQSIHMGGRTCIFPYRFDSHLLDFLSRIYTIWDARIYRCPYFCNVLFDGTCKWAISLELVFVPHVHR